MFSLTLQSFVDGHWQDGAQLDFPNGEDGDFRTTQLTYLTEYAVDWLDLDDHHSVSINQPVQLYPDGPTNWFRFLDDIMPSGASRRYWVSKLDIDALPISTQNFLLLSAGTIAPIGNWRVKEAVFNDETKPFQNEQYNRHFSIDDVKNRASDFLDYAQQRGAAAGGATGAGGEAPKLLLRVNEKAQVWIDLFQDDRECQDTHYLVKYPRGQRTEIDNDILRAEFWYYQQLKRMGFETIPTSRMKLIEGNHYPSLWLPRFDIEFNRDGLIKRYAMESVYSMLNAAPAAPLEHGETIRRLISKIQGSHLIQSGNAVFRIEDFVTEWVKRDLLNITFGNSDNHGRNTSFMRYENEIRLAPIYDFAPMKADPEGIPRSMRWGRPELEIGGDFNFRAICNSLSDLLEPEQLLSELQILATRLQSLPDDLRELGVPEQILGHPSIGFRFITEKLERWGLL